MTAAMSEMDHAISEYKSIGARIKVLEAQKEDLKATIKFELGSEDRYVGPRGSVARVSFFQRKANFDLAKKLLDADVYYEIITETPVEQLRVS